MNKSSGQKRRSWGKLNTITCVKHSEDVTLLYLLFVIETASKCLKHDEIFLLIYQFIFYIYIYIYIYI